VIDLIGSCYTEDYFIMYEPTVYTTAVNAYCANIDGTFTLYNSLFERRPL